MSMLPVHWPNSDCALLLTTRSHCAVCNRFHIQAVFLFATGFDQILRWYYDFKASCLKPFDQGDLLPLLMTEKSMR